MDFDDYLATVPEHRQERFRKLLSLMASLYPTAVTSMKHRMPTFSNGDGWVAVANQKSYISLYTCSAEHLVEFKQRFPAVRTGKGCVNIQDRDDFPLRELASVISSAMENQISD